MLFKVITKVNWKEDAWENLFNLVNDFKNNFTTTLTPYKVTSIGNADKEYYFTISRKYTVYFVPNSQGYWLTFEADTNKKDFDEKFEFIVNRIN